MKASGMKFWMVFSDPAYIARSRLLKHVSLLVDGLKLDGSGTWLDVGCGSRPYESLINSEKYIGMDVAESGNPAGRKRCDLLYDGVTFPIGNESVDGVICTQVLEHAKDPGGMIAEIRRVLRPSGSLILSAPFSWQEHEKPYDFTRFSSYGLINMLKWHGFQIKEHYKTTGSIETIAQAISVYIINNLCLGVPGWGRLLTFFFCAPVQILGLFCQRVLPDSRDLFLDNVVLAYSSKKMRE